MTSIYYSKITYEKLQLKRLGKKLKLFIIRQNEKFSSGLEISSKIYGPTSEKNCLNKMKTLKTKKVKHHDN